MNLYEVDTIIILKLWMRNRDMKKLSNLLKAT